MIFDANKKKARAFFFVCRNYIIFVGTNKYDSSVKRVFASKSSMEMLYAKAREIWRMQPERRMRMNMRGMHENMRRLPWEETLRQG